VQECSLSLGGKGNAKAASSTAESDTCCISRLYDLFMYWYGFDKVRHNVADYTMPPAALREQWDNVWFAKTHEVDEFLRHRFMEIIPRMMYYQPSNGIEFMGKMILYDQVVRNVFRGRPEAYNYEHISLAMAKQVVQDASYGVMPLFAKISVILVFIHSESLADQQIARQAIIVLRQDPAFQGIGLLRTLTEISDRHTARIELFGRLPERASIKGLPLTDAEKLYLASI
jgi:uncharacterized protein (DUF924 family)